jgi:hypothetical protein
MGFSNYPNSIDTSNQLPPVVDLRTPVIAEVVNRHRDAILAIENELGVNPSGTYGTVRARFDALDARLAFDTSIFILVDGTRAFTGNQSLGNNLLTNLGAAASDGDALSYGQSSANLADLTVDTGPLTVGNVIRGTDDGTGIIVGHQPTGANTGSLLQLIGIDDADVASLVAAEGMLLANNDTSVVNLYIDGSWKTVATTDIDGTSAAFFMINDDLTAVTNQDSLLRIRSADGVSLWTADLKLNGTTDPPILEYFIEGSADDAIVSIGEDGTTANVTSTLLFNSGTGAINGEASISFDAADGYFDVGNGATIINMLAPIHMNNQRISEVADGILGTDAVNRRQLDAIVPTENVEQLTAIAIVGDAPIPDTLDNVPLDVTKVTLYLNGLKQLYGAGNDFTVSGQTVTWLVTTGTAVPMAVTDIVQVDYLSA